MRRNVGMLGAAVLAASAIGSGFIQPAMAATILGQPTVETEAWTGFEDGLNVKWSADARYFSPGFFNPSTVFLLTPSPAIDPGQYGGSSVSFKVIDVGSSLPTRTFRDAPDLSAIGPLRYEKVIEQADAVSKSIIQYKGTKGAAYRAGHGDAASVSAQVYHTANRELLNLTAAHAGSYGTTNDDGISLLARVSAEDLWRKKWKNRSTTVGRGNALFDSFFEVTRDTTFDLTAEVSAIGDAAARLVLIDLDTKERLLIVNQPKSGRQKTLEFSGELDAGRYRLLVTADTTVNRRNGKLEQQGGAAMLRIDLQTESVIPDEVFREQARLGQLTYDEMMGLFNLDDDALAYAVGAGALAKRYINEHTGMSDLELVEHILAGEQTPGDEWRYGPDDPFEVDALRRVLSVLPDFEVLDADGQLVYDTINGSADPDDGTRNYVDAFGWYNGDLIRFGPDYTISLLAEQNSLAARAPQSASFWVVPEPGSLALLAASGAGLARRRRR